MSHGTRHSRRAIWSRECPDGRSTYSQRWRRPAETSADGLPATAFLVLFGHIGLTSYFGLIEIGQPKQAKRLVVSAAAGAVGSIVGQIGKIKGCHVVGIAGTDEKCKWIKEELGFDEAINYKSGSVFENLKKACPKGIDIYFENVGGEILEAVLALINNHARIPLCGLISQYNATSACFRTVEFRQLAGAKSSA